MLRDGDGSVVFTMSNVEAMEMQDNGNWALYDAKNQVIWQSFDHPSDTLLQGQNLNLGMKLESNNSLYIAEMMSGGVVFYYNAKAPAHLTYWAVPANISLVQYVAQNPFELSRNPSVNLTYSLEYNVCPSSSQSPSSSQPTPYAFFSGSNLTIQGDCSSYTWSDFTNIFQNSTVLSDFLVLANDGYPKAFTYLHSLGNNFLFSGQANSSYCLAPYTCGSYGICDELLFGLQHSCRCPSVLENMDFQDAFERVDPSDPTQGCRRRVPLQCSGDAGYSRALVEIKKSSFVSIHPFYETTYMQNTFPLPECIARCARNCSCSGFFYHQGSSFCLPFSDDGMGDMPNLTFITMESPEFSTYIKIQHPIEEEVAHFNSTVTSHSSSHFSKAGGLIIGGGVLVLVLLVCAIATLLTYKRMKRLKDIEEEDLEAGEDEELRKVLPILPVRFSYKELYKATDGFSIKNEIGSGGFGHVYQAVFPDGRKLAVKKLDQGSPRLKQFLAEVAIIGDVSHFNIAPLRGFCSHKSHRLLVYELMENGSLDKWLFKDLLLDWNTRYQIALGTARGLAYLHEECPRPIIHFDVKPQNILLDKEFVAKISDFGMCKLVGRAESSCVMTGVRGTPGYLAPEWLSYTTVGKKCDVYSYGMVLLEMVGGRKNALQELGGSEEWYFPMWAAMLCKQGRFKEIVDKRLEGIYEEEQVRRMVHVAFLCIQRDPSLRPSMGCVCKMIEGSLTLGDEEPPFDLALEPLSPLHPGSLSYSCASTLLVGR